MKLLPLLATLVVGFSVPLLANKAEKQDPDQMAKASHKMSASFLKEPESLEAHAATLTGKDAAAVTKFAKMTRDEGEALAKAAEAWDKNQIRLAERHMKDASELCSARGKLSEDIQKIMKTSSPKKGDTCEPAEVCKPDPAKKSAATKDAAPEKKAAASSDFQSLQEQASQLGKSSE
jgi:hypothetical protein